MNQMKQYISTVQQCTGKIGEIAGSASRYQANVRMNLLTIAATVYMLICSVMKFNKILIGAGAVIAVAAILLLKDFGVSTSKAAILFLVGMVVSSIVCFMFFYNFVPVIFAFLGWITVVFSNYQMKKRAWEIAKGM